MTSIISNIHYSLPAKWTNDLNTLFEDEPISLSLVKKESDNKIDEFDDIINIPEHDNIKIVQLEIKICIIRDGKKKIVPISISFKIPNISNDKIMSPSKNMSPFKPMSPLRTITETPNSLFCTSFGTSDLCPHGKKCKFAHSIEQHNPTKCGYGEKCRYITSENDMYLNIPDTRKCTYIHPNESKNIYYNRIGMMDRIKYAEKKNKMVNKLQYEE